MAPTPPHRDPSATAAAPQMPPQPTTRTADRGPRVVVYHQTHYQGGRFVSMLPLLSERTGVTHVVVAALHVNERPGDITLNDAAWDDAGRHGAVWAEARALQAAGIRVLAMLGGAAKGTYARLDGPAARFEAYYAPLRGLLAATGVDGVDLDVEEDMSLPGMVRLLDRLRADFGPAFTLTMAPVATALVGRKHLSGFSYLDLEKAMGRHVAWYNTQFYCGWGSAETTEHYDAIVAAGWPPRKVVLGVVTNPDNGAGWVFPDLLLATVGALKEKYPDFGGVMGWEYFNSLGAFGAAQEAGKAWLWAEGMGMLLRSDIEEVAETQQEVKDDQGAETAVENPFLQIVKGS